jgi:hypothetical protein
MFQTLHNCPRVREPGAHRDRHGGTGMRRPAGTVTVRTPVGTRAAPASAARRPSGIKRPQSRAISLSTVASTSPARDSAAAAVPAEKARRLSGTSPARRRLAAPRYPPPQPQHRVPSPPDPRQVQVRVCCTAAVQLF